MMTKPSTPEQEFEAYMTGDSDLSRLYQQSKADGPSELTDKRILNAAREAVIEHRKTRTPWKKPLLPAAIAAGVIILSLVLVVQFHDQTAQNPEREIDSSFKPDPAHSLREIVKLVKAGQTAIARDQYQAFKELYPDYQIDYNQFPELQQFKDSD